MRVVIDSDKGYVFPNVCSCCLGVSDCTEVMTGSRGVATATATMPVCSMCVEHRKVGQSAASWLGLGAVLVWAASFAIPYALDVPRRFEKSALGQGLLVLLMVLLASIPIAYFWIRRRWRLANPTHATVGRPVKVFPYSYTDIAFEFRNAEYARAFREANQGALSRRWE